jgi:hypothetical protein
MLKTYGAEMNFEKNNLEYQIAYISTGFASCLHWNVKTSKNYFDKYQSDLKSKINLLLLFEKTNPTSEVYGQELFATHQEIVMSSFYPSEKPIVFIGQAEHSPKMNSIDMEYSVSNPDVTMNDKAVKICMYNDKAMKIPYRKVQKNQRIYFRLELVKSRDSELYQCFYHHSCEMKTTILQLSQLALCASNYDFINKGEHIKGQSKADKLTSHMDCSEGEFLVNRVGSKTPGSHGTMKRIFDFSDPTHPIVNDYYEPEIYHDHNCPSKIIGSFIDKDADKNKYYTTPATLQVFANIEKMPNYKPSTTLQHYKTNLMPYQKATTALSFFHSNTIVGGCPNGLYYEGSFWDDCVNGFNWYVGYGYRVIIFFVIAVFIFNIFWFLSCLKKNKTLANADPLKKIEEPTLVLPTETKSNVKVSTTVPKVKTQKPQQVQPVQPQPQPQTKYDTIFQSASGKSKVSSSPFDSMKNFTKNMNKFQ